MGIFKSKKAAEVEPKEEIETKVEQEKRDPEYVWVEGFKGTELDMTCRGFQFEFGKTYAVDKPVLCENGFHFCLNLGDVFGYYEAVFSHRFFKVRALVEKSQLDLYGKIDYSGCYSHTIDKLVAKEIEFLEEVPRTDLFESYKYSYEWLDNVDELNSIADYNAYETFVNEKVAALLNGRYSETFSMLVLGTGVPSRDLVNRMIALADEEISPDMRAYLLLNTLSDSGRVF